MTTKEVIQRLENIKDSATMAKKALRASETFEMVADDIELDEEAIDIAIEALENQNIGHWVAEFVPREQPDNWDRIAIKCSECGVIKTRITYNSDTMDFNETVGDYTNTLKRNHYCFNCGAKMIEQQESE